MAMAFDISQVLGGMSTTPGQPVNVPAPRTPITNNRAHTDGGRVASAANANVNQPDKQVLYDSALIVVGALIFLWVAGALVFKTHNI
jgi:hypothetical protein